MNDTIHFVLQGKGGVGKSLIASLLTQHLNTRHGNVLPVDTDPVNHTLTRIKSLAAQPLEILDPVSQNIDPRRFDQLIDWALNHPGPLVIDNGASTFVPLQAYLHESGALDLLADNDRRVLIHCVLVGGQAFADTVGGLQALLTSTRVPIVVWQNAFFGPVEQDGRGFTDSGIYSKHADRIHGLVTLAARSPDTYGRDISAMTSAGLTFDEAMASSQFGAMPRHRLGQVWSDIHGQLSAIDL